MRKLFILIAATCFVSYLYSQDAKEIVSKSYEMFNGKTSQSVMSMKIVRPTWSRTIEMKSWSKGTEYSMVLITAPAKEKGQVFMKRKKEMWNWVPGINRMIKLPPSMMSQSWMGSDFTNDDLVNEASIVKDYTQKILGNEKISGYDCYKIEMIPDPDAAIVWGKVITWISKTGYMTLKNEYYDEDDELINTEIASQIKKLGDRTIPTKFTITPEDEKDNQTILEFISIDFDIEISEDFFSQQKMKSIR
ncbi:MAG: outer membrane lipoprotein-sorting protein [Bacteroidota bacterium]